MTTWECVLITLGCTKMCMENIMQSRQYKPLVKRYAQSSKKKPDIYFIEGTLWGWG